jgi:NitT/TauT family transport system substrate-binding protein
VQFAPIYVALARGYWANRGLDVRIEYGDETDFLRRVGANDMQAVVAGGDQVLLARSQGVPVKYVATWHHRFPVAVFGLDPELDEPADLTGKKIGIPMLGGVTTLGLRALLANAAIPEDAVQTEVVGFNQVQSVLTGQVDAAVGYAVNEPLRLRADGHEPGVIEVADLVNFVANGLVVSELSAAEKKDVVQRLVGGFLDGIAFTLASKDEAFAIAIDAVPEADDPAASLQARSVFDESIRFWTPAGSIGAIDAAQWKESADIMTELGLLEGDVQPDEAVDTTFADGYNAAP